LEFASFGGATGALVFDRGQLSEGSQWQWWNHVSVQAGHAYETLCQD